MKTPEALTPESALNQLLSKLQADGTAESEGTFTISPQTAAEMMRRFRLPDPHMYLLQMVAAACCGRARHLSILTTSRVLKFTFHGLEVGVDQLRALDTFLFPLAGAPEHITELAVGVEAALNLAEEVRVESLTPSGCWRLIVSPKSTRLETLEPINIATPACRVIVKRKLGLGSLWKINKYPELGWLESCRHADLMISLDGWKVATELLPPLPKETILWAKIVRSDKPVLVPQSGDAAAVVSPSIVLEHSEVFGFLALVPREVAYRQGLIFVHRGLSVLRPLTDLGLHVVCGVLHCDFLKKDLSHTNFVEDQNFEYARSFLRELSIELVTEFCSQLHLHREAWSHLWATVVSLLRDTPLRPEQESVIKAWADHLHQTGEAQGPFSDLQKARFLQREGQFAEAEHLRRKLACAVQAEALAKFDSGQINALADHCEVLLALFSDHQSPFTEQLHLARRIVASLSGTPNPEPSELPLDPLSLHRWALLRRRAGHLAGAVELHLQALEHEQADELVRGWGIRYCAELEFSQLRYQQALELYQMAEEELPKQRDLFEERAFFDRFMGPDFRPSALSYLRRALEGVEVDSFVHWLLVEEVKKEGRARLTRSELAALQTKSTYLSLKKLMEEGAQATIEADLKASLDLEGWTSREELIDKKLKALFTAESAFGPTYLYTRYCRRRCVYQIHRLGDPELAHQLQCRGHLLDHLRLILSQASLE